MLNEVFLIGNITHDLQKKYVILDSKEIAVVNFQIAINTHYGEKNKPQFVNCVIFREKAENFFKYLKKGSRVFLKGSLSVNKYVDNNNVKHNNINIVIHHVVYLDKKDNNNDNESRETWIDNLTYDDLKHHPRKK